MAGHSKWANIQHRKGAQDKKRGKLFTKLIRNITVAARGGADIEANAALRHVFPRSKTAWTSSSDNDRAKSRVTSEMYNGSDPDSVLPATCS